MVLSLSLVKISEIRALKKYLKKNISKVSKRRQEAQELISEKKRTLSNRKKMLKKYQNRLRWKKKTKYCHIKASKNEVPIISNNMSKSSKTNTLLFLLSQARL